MWTPRRLLGGLLGATGVCAAGFACLLVVAYASEPAARLDAVALDQFGDPLQRQWLARLAADVAHLVNPAPFAFLAAAVCIVALLRRGSREAVAVAVLVVGANVTTQLLKPVLAEPRGTLGGWILGPEAFPSGHATASMSLALAVVLAVPHVARPVAAAVGALFAIGVGFALVALDAHFPSDVAGGYLVAGGWAFAVLAGLLVIDQRRQRRLPPDSGGRGAIVVAGALLAGVALAAVVGAARFATLLDYARGHTVFAGVAALTAALAVVIVAAVTVAASSVRAVSEDGR